MQIEEIQAKIKEGSDIERRTGSLRRAVGNLVRRSGVRVDDQELDKLVAFVTRYIEHAPVLMMAIEEAATQNGTLNEIQPILDATADYFQAPDDVIPDRYGLVGLLDDAYLAHSLMETISDRYKLKSGRSLLPIEAPGLNTFVRRLIGVPFVGILDDHVARTIDNLGIESDVDRMLAAFEEIDLLSTTDSLWGNLNASDVSVLRILATRGQ